MEEPEIKVEYYDTFETDPLCNRKNVKVQSPNILPILKYVNTNNELDEHNRQLLSQDNSTDSEKSFDNNINEAETWHRKMNHEGRLLCKFCDLTYSSTQTLCYHVKKKHCNEAENLKTVIINNRRNSKLRCHICKKYFKLIRDLKNHVNQFHDMQNIKKSCLYCGAVFEDESKMMEHLRVKHDISSITKLHYCTVCGYRTMKISHFKQHQNTHSFNKDKKCKLCNYSTNYMPNLKIHERIHSNYKPYACDFLNCDYQSSTKSALRSHQLKHYPDENMIYCDKCSYKTVYKQSLKKHINSHVRNTINT